MLSLELSVGEQVFFRHAADNERYSAMISSVSEPSVIIRANADVPKHIGKGEWLVISLPDSEFYTEIVSRDGNMFSLKMLWCDRREYFRVDDVFPVVCKKVGRENAPKKTRLVSGIGNEAMPFDLPDSSINPQLWKMLVDINTKLSLVLERLNLQGEGLLDAESRMVNISATGLRFKTGEKADIGDSVEIKMLLPTYPPVGIITFGRVVRVDKSEGEYDLALHFEEMDEDVRDEIIQYAIRRQRDIARSQRQKEK